LQKYGGGTVGFAKAFDMPKVARQKSAHIGKLIAQIGG
jgi:hypothetical protein